MQLDRLAGYEGDVIVNPEAGAEAETGADANVEVAAAGTTESG